jgi:hypothetical protein
MRAIATPLLVLSFVLAAAGCKRNAGAPASLAPQASAPAGDVGAISTTSTGEGFRLKLPPGKVTVTGRTATVSLPVRNTSGFAWSTSSILARPWRLTQQSVKPGAGPDGTDLAVFVFSADGVGSAPLSFTLAPAKGPGAPVMTFTAEVRAR